MPDYQKFAAFLAKYYMEFLETDFKRQRIPKRRISGYHDINNHLIGLNLNKYEKFGDSIRSLIEKGDIHNKTISVKKDQYTTALNKTATALIEKQIRLCMI